VTPGLKLPSSGMVGINLCQSVFIIWLLDSQVFTYGVDEPLPRKLCRRPRMK